MESTRDPGSLPTPISASVPSPSPGKMVPIPSSPTFM
ncbi:hypothetical protein LEMLEM_LOCUS20062 [Lemmus lemmus]